MSSKEFAIFVKTIYLCCDIYKNVTRYTNAIFPNRELSLANQMSPFIFSQTHGYITTARSGVGKLAALTPHLATSQNPPAI